MNQIWRIIRFTKNLWPYYTVISILSVILALIALMQPLFTGWLIDEIQNGASSSDLTRVVILVSAIFLADVLSNLVSNIIGFFGDQMSVRLFQTLSHKYFKHVLSLPQSYFDSELTGKIVNRLNRSINQISNFMQSISNNFLQFIFTTIFGLVFVAYYSWQVALMLFMLYPVFVLMTVKTSGKWQKYQQKINNFQDIGSGRFAEAIGQVKVVKSYIQEKHEYSFFARQVQGAIRLVRPQSKLWHVKDVQRRLILNVIFFMVYLYIFIMAANGEFSTGQAVALILYAAQIRMPIFTISYLVDSTQRAVADSRDYFEVMDVEPEITDIADAKNLKVNKGQIIFESVSFSYGQKNVLNEVTLTIDPDSKVALVGESGEGKTTITNLLMRLYEPQNGTILVDGQDINNVTQESLRKNIGIVFQDPALFSGTIRENIAYARPRAKDADVIAAAKAANAHEFITGFDKKYDTEIGERGLKLSGGQKQRIAIARAILKDAPILILDEATSSLDSKSEAYVQEALQRLMKGRTTLIIAHRLSTISHVDKIITLSGGKVDEVGSPDELAKTGGIYAGLLKMQHGSAEDIKKQLKKYEIKA
jgi:ATP-binding cassette subfamily B protein